MELHEYLRVIRQRWILITACVLVVTGLAALLTFRASAVYQSDVRLFIARVGESGSKAYEGSLLSVQRMSTYADLARGREVARRVVDDLDLDLPAESLVGRITATSAPESVILSLSAQDSDPKLAQQIAASASQQLIEIIEELETPPGESATPIKTVVVDTATLPTSPISPQPMRNIGLGLVLGLMLGLGLAVLWEVLTRPTPAAERAYEPVGARSGPG